LTSRLQSSRTSSTSSRTRPSRASALEEELKVELAKNYASKEEINKLQGELTEVRASLAKNAEEMAELEKAKSLLDGLKTQVEALETDKTETLALHAAEVERLTGRIAEIEAERDECMEKYGKEHKERRRLHNEVMELKGNIRVFCRLRPMLNSKGEVAVTARGGDEMVAADESSGKVNSFQYDQVFGSEPLVTSVVDGFNACIFAYGQTGSGKTHTRMGNQSDPGIIVRGLEHLFDVTEKRSEINWSFGVTMLEIYNEAVRDLLSTKKESVNLDIKQDTSTGAMYCPNAPVQDVFNMQDVLDFLALTRSDQPYGGRHQV